MLLNCEYSLLKMNQRRVTVPVHSPSDLCGAGYILDTLSDYEGHEYSGCDTRVGNITAAVGGTHEHCARCT